jgi:hypothetical protein
MRWYSSPGRLLRVDAETEIDTWVTARGQRKADLTAMIQEIPGSWINSAASR